MSMRADMSRLKSRVAHAWDYIMVAAGAAALVLTFIRPDDPVSIALAIAAGVIGVIYLVTGVLLYFIDRVKFDWHLVNGNYILKIVALVLLVPFSISLSISIFQPLQVEDFVYDDQLFVHEAAVDSLVIAHKDSLEVVLPLYKSGNEGVLTVESSSLPESVSAKQENPPFLWGVYFHFIDPGNQHMTASKEGRLWAALIALLGVFLLNGLLVSAIVGWVDSRKSKWAKGEIRYQGLLKCRRHYVVVGTNDMSDGIIKQLLDRDKCLVKPLVLVLTSCDIEKFRQELFTGLTAQEQRRLVICYGNRISPEDIKSLQLRMAKEVYVLGEDPGKDDSESYHDTMNMECLKLISKEIAGISKFKKQNGADRRLICRVMFEYQTTFNIFQVTDIDGTKINFLPFNYYEKWAQNVLICQNLSNDPSDYGYLPLEGVNGLKYSDPHHVHLVVVGMSRMGVAMAIEAAHLAHYPNFEEKHIKTKITFIDKNAYEEKDFFIGRFKALFALSDWEYREVVGDALKLVKKKMASTPKHLGGDFVDVEWEFINGSVEAPAVQHYLSKLSADENTRLTIAICLPENNRALAAAAYLPDDVYKSKNTLQVLVYQRFNDELLHQISENNKRYCKKMKAFGMANDCYDSSLVDLCEFLGGKIGVAYKEWTEKNLTPKKKVDDKGKSVSAKMWSNQYNIYSMWTKFRCVTTSDGKVFNPLVCPFDDFKNSTMRDRLGMMEHNRWVVEQLLLRYRPLTEDEQKKVQADMDLKDVFKSDDYAHFDICSNQMLQEVDKLMPDLDKTLIDVLPQAYKDYMTPDVK